MPARVREALVASQGQAAPQAHLLAGGRAFPVPATILGPLVPLEPLTMALAVRGLARVEVLLPDTNVEEVAAASELLLLGSVTATQATIQATVSLLERLGVSQVEVTQVERGSDGTGNVEPAEAADLKLEVVQDLEEYFENLKEADLKVEVTPGPLEGVRMEQVAEAASAGLVVGVKVLARRGEVHEPWKQGMVEKVWRRRCRVRFNAGRRGTEWQMLDVSRLALEAVGRVQVGEGRQVLALHSVQVVEMEHIGEIFTTTWFKLSLLF